MSQHHPMNHKFCTRCGRALVQLDKIVGYNAQTGRPQRQTVKICPNHCATEEWQV